MTVVLASPGSGAGQTTLQGAYDNSAGADPQILLNNTPTPISIEASVSGSVLEIRDAGAANVIFEVDADPDLIVARAGVTIDNAFSNGGASSYLTFTDTFTTGGGYLGGCILSNGTITYDNSFFIWALLQESKIYQAAAGPGFAAFTLFNALAVIRNSGNFDLVQALVLNSGVTHQRVTSGTSLTAQNTGLSFAGGLRTTVSGAIMRYTGGPYGMVYTPNFGTVAGSTVDFENCKTVWARNPSVALFQPQAGVETMNSYVALEIDNISFGGNVTKRGMRSALTEATNTLMIENTGGANSDFGGGGIHFDDSTPVQFGGTAYNAQDASIFWNATGFLEFFFAANSDSFEISNSVNNQIVIAGDTTSVELALDFERGVTIGDASTLGNQFVNIVQPSFTPAAAGEVSGVLLTQSGNYTNNGLTRGRVSAWVVNGFSYANSSGTVNDSDTLTVGGMVTSSPGVTIDERQSLHVIAGRSRFDSAMQFEPINPATLANGNNNDWAGLLTGSPNNNMRHWARVTPDNGGSNITGIDASSAQDGDFFRITNIGTGPLNFTDQDVNSSASNRIITPNALTVTLTANESATLIRDATTDRWRVTSSTGNF